ncbi:MAG: hypothetical protein WAW23_03255 [Candidatus Methanoperedens sp.]
MEIIENREAQFMLLAGFIIGIGLVIITVLFNNIIFQTNIAGSTGADPLKYDIANMMQITSDEMKSAYRNVTAPGQNATLKFINFTNQMQNFNSNLSKIYALRAGGVNMSIDVRNWNNSLYANFTDNGTANGASNWVVMENVKNFTLILNVTTTGVYINFTNATKSWEPAPSGYPAGFPFMVGNYSINESSYPQNITPPYTAIRFNKGLLATSGAGRFNITGNTTDGRRFIRARDYMLNATVTLTTKEIRANITIPISVPW